MIVLFIGVWVVAQALGVASAMEGQISWIEAFAPSLAIIGFIVVVGVVDFVCRAFSNAFWFVDKRIGITPSGRYSKRMRERAKPAGRMIIDL